MDKTQLKEFLVERVRSHWGAGQNVLFLADIPTELREHKQLDYKDILGDVRLKAFAKETEGEDGYRLVAHPSQRAKLGLVPFEVEFEFPDNDADDSGPTRKHRIPRNASKTTLEFLAILNSLPEKDQAEISIPARIIARLLSEK